MTAQEPLSSTASQPLGTASPPPAPEDAALFSARIRHWARVQPDAPACTFVDYAHEREGTTRTWSYADLDRRARAVAAAVATAAEPGQRVAIVLPQSLDYLAAFLGCQYAGVIAVPLHAPHLRRNDSKLATVFADCAPAATFTETSHADLVAGLGGQGTPGAGTILTTDSIEAAETNGAESRLTPHAVTPHDPAYLQYTSGSTRSPAGVIVTHDNLRVATAQLASFTELAAGETQVSWLPFFHDMGLVLGASMPLSAGAHGVFFAPYAFIHRPVRWLQLISRHRARTSASPNFGLDLAVLRVAPAQREGLDLSSLRHIVNGAEPIRAASLRRFTAAYAPHGFPDRAHTPGYGLAEATLAVTLGPREGGAVIGTFDRAALTEGKAVPVADAHPETVALVGCGQVWQQQLAIVDPGSGAPLGDGAVGEVWVRGANVCPGYFGKAEETAQTFNTALRTDADPGPGAAAAGTEAGWLRTGDLGFLHEGLLYLTARLKDLIIVRGTNHYPTDIENTVEAALPQARVGHVAAFAVEHEDAEGVVVVCELDPGKSADLDPVAALRTVRLAVQARHQIEIHDVVLTPQSRIPKTTSGKIQRRACRDRYAVDGLGPAVARLRPS